jgi:hypothetical protein
MQLPLMQNLDVDRKNARNHENVLDLRPKKSKQPHDDIGEDRTSDIFFASVGFNGNFRGQKYLLFIENKVLHK